MILRDSYWKSFLVLIIVSAILWISKPFFSFVSKFFDAILGFSTAASSGLIDRAISFAFGSTLSKIIALPYFSALWILALLFSWVISLIYTLLISEPLDIGLCRFFMRARHGNTELSNIGFSYKFNFTNVVFISFFKELYLALWTLLLLIPGIVKAYEYYMIPYILSENPHLSKRRVFELSRAMTDGEKWNIFVLELSFIGWHLLCLLTLGIGEFFLAPYIAATKAELYAAMRDKLFYLGISNLDELPGFAY